MSELKPCPFCGGAASINGDDDGRMYVECGLCAASSMCAVPIKADASMLLLAAWNRRATPPNVARVIEEMEQESGGNRQFSIERFRVDRWIKLLRGEQP